MENISENIIIFDETFADSTDADSTESKKETQRKESVENLDNEISDKLKKIYDDYIYKIINKKNYKKYQKLFSEIEIKNEVEGRIYYKLSVFLNNIELERKIASISREMDKKIEELNLKIKKLDDNSKELEDNIKVALKESHDMKAEILTMMGLFFAIFTFVQVNFTFTHQFLEKYNGYRLLLYITIINAVLLIVLGFMLEAIGTIVYGKNKAREGIIIEDTQNINSKKIWLRKFCTEKYWKSQKYLWLFPESKLKMKRALVYSLIGLFVIGAFSFYNEKKNYSRSYEEIEKIILEKVDKKISSSDRKLSESEKREIKMEIENNIYRTLYNQNREIPQEK